MTNLTLIAPFREHDLPVKWDGRKVTWSEEPTMAGAVFICPPPREIDACTSCGLLAADGAEQYVGYFWTTEPAYWTRDRQGRKRRHPEREVRHAALFLTRCMGCGHDRVSELESGQQWDLDESDYTDEGSWPNGQGGLW